MGPLVEHHQSGKKYKILFENAPLGIFVVDTDGKILDVNAACLKILGSPGQEATKAINVLTFPPLVEAGVSAALKQCMSEGALVRHNTPYTSAWGKTSHLRMVLAALFTDKGKVEGCQATVEDITEQKRAEEALRESEARFRFLAEAMVDVVWTLDLNFQTTYVSPSIETILGFTQEERRQQRIEEQVTPESLLKIRELLAAELDKELEGTADPNRNITILAEHYKKDGGTLWLESSVRAIRDGHGVLIGIHGLSRDITERKKAEEKIRTSEERFRLLADNMTDIIWQMSPDFVLTYVSPSVKTQWGYEPSETFGRPIWDFVTPASLEEVHERALGRLQQLLSDRDNFIPAPYEAEQIRKDGTTVWTETMAAPFFDSDGKLLGFQGVTRDVSERKHAEELLRQTHRRLEESQRIARIGTWEWNAVTGETFWSDEVYRIFGFEPRSVVPSNEFFKGITYSADADVWEETVSQSLSLQQERFDIDLRVLRKDGEITWVHIQGDIIRERGGRPTGFLATVQDISDRKKMEESLRESERMKSMVLENTREIFTCFDRDLRILWANKAASESLHLSPERLVGKHCYELWHCQTDPCEECPVRLAIETGVPQYLDDRITPDGKHWSVRGYPVFDEEGNVEGVTQLVVDITRRKNLEAQLLQSQKMEALGTLAAGIAHDFNNMLQVILGYSDLLLLRKKEGELGYKELQRIVKTSQEARDLVQKIRLFSGRADIQPVPTDMNRRIDEIAKFLRHTLPKTITIDTHLAEDIQTINADPGLMDQLLMNLAINAGEAMPDGGTITLQTKNILLDKDFCHQHLRLEPGPHVLVTVSDTGRGIEKDRLGRLFDPFYSTKTRDYHRGTGLGLPIVRGIVELHKGSIHVHSELGKGTAFRIYIPVLETPESPRNVKDEALSCGGNETILLVEDEALVREMSIAMLEQFGYKVLAVGDGQEAVEVYEREENNISLVILDIIMPRMDGKDCLKQLLRINPEVKVLISSGVVQDDLLQEVVNIGATGSITKPFDVEGLLNKVREILDSR